MGCCAHRRGRRQQTCYRNCSIRNPPAARRISVAAHRPFTVDHKLECLLPQCDWINKLSFKFGHFRKMLFIWSGSMLHLRIMIEVSTQTNNHYTKVNSAKVVFLLWIFNHYCSILQLLLPCSNWWIRFCFSCIMVAVQDLKQSIQTNEYFIHCDLFSVSCSRYR